MWQPGFFVSGQDTEPWVLGDAEEEMAAGHSAPSTWPIGSPAHFKDALKVGKPGDLEFGEALQLE